MGYYANYSGGIYLTKCPEEAEHLGKDTFENFEVDADGSVVCMSFGGYEKYYEDTVYEFLDLIKPYTLRGSIEYKGEDDAMWRFVYKDDGWEEQSGRIMYEDEPIAEELKPEFLGQIVDIFDDEIDPEKPTFTGKRYDAIVEKLQTLMKGWRIF